MAGLLGGKDLKDNVVKPDLIIVKGNRIIRGIMIIDAQVVGEQWELDRVHQNTKKSMVQQQLKKQSSSGLERSQQALHRQHLIEGGFGRQD